jgi:hypothetical protein
MKSIAYLMIFYFSLGALIPKGDFSQLLKINELLEHYSLHQQEASVIGEECSFLGFMYLHFVSSDEHQHHSQDEHEQLPLYSLSTSILLYCEDFFGALNWPEYFESAGLPVYTTVFQCIAISDIFRPPISSL